MNTIEEKLQSENILVKLGYVLVMTIWDNGVDGHDGANRMISRPMMDMTMMDIELWQIDK